MICKYCFSDTKYGHAAGCPNYNPKVKIKNNSQKNLGNIILKVAEKNSDGEYIHRDCIPGIDFLIDWLGYEVHEMGKNGYYDSWQVMNSFDVDKVPVYFE